MKINIEGEEIIVPGCFEKKEEKPVCGKKDECKLTGCIWTTPELRGSNAIDTLPERRRVG